MRRFISLIVCFICCNLYSMEQLPTTEIVRYPFDPELAARICWDSVDIGTFLKDFSEKDRQYMGREIFSYIEEFPKATAKNSLAWDLFDLAFYKNNAILMRLLLTKFNFYNPDFTNKARAYLHEAVHCNRTGVFNLLLSRMHIEPDVLHANYYLKQNTKENIYQYACEQLETGYKIYKYEQDYYTFPSASLENAAKITRQILESTKLSPLAQQNPFRKKLEAKYQEWKQDIREMLNEKQIID